MLVSRCLPKDDKFATRAEIFQKHLGKNEFVIVVQKKRGRRQVMTKFFEKTASQSSVKVRLFQSVKYCPMIDYVISNFRFP